MPSAVPDPTALCVLRFLLPLSALLSPPAPLGAFAPDHLLSSSRSVQIARYQTKAIHKNENAYLYESQSMR